VAFAVIDDYRGQGAGTALTHNLSSIARQAGLNEVIAEVLASSFGGKVHAEANTLNLEKRSCPGCEIDAGTDESTGLEQRTLPQVR
jgi:hypothetical protein